MNTKYCMYPVEDGRCGVPFSTRSIKSSRKYCEEHFSFTTNYTDDSKIVYSPNKYAQVTNMKEMHNWVRSEMASGKITNEELLSRITLLNNRIDSLRASFGNKEMSFEESIIKRIDSAISTAINENIDYQKYVDKLQGQLVILNNKLIKLTKVVNKQSIELKEYKKITLSNNITLNNMDLLNKNNRIYKNIMNKNKNERYT